jgi:hypothetical protein
LGIGLTRSLQPGGLFATPRRLQLARGEHRQQEHVDRHRVTKQRAPQLAGESEFPDPVAHYGRGRPALLPLHVCQEAEHDRPRRPVLLEVDQQLAERPVLLQDPVEVPTVGNALQFVLAGVLEQETRSSDQVLHSL